MPLIPFPELWEWIFSFPSRSRISGMDFFHSLPVPEFWEWDFFIPFPFPKFGNGFFYSLPVPEFREWAFSIPFPFPNFGNGLFQFPSRSRTLKSHSRSPLICIFLTPSASRQVPRCQTYLPWFSRWPQSQTRWWSPHCLSLITLSERSLLQLLLSECEICSNGQAGV